MIPLGLFLFPVLEIMTTGSIIQRFGFGNAFFLWLLSTIFGFGLFRATSGRLSYGIAQALRRGESPGHAAVKSALIGLSGLLFLVPGFLSDILGLIVLIPFVRSSIATRLLAKVKNVAPSDAMAQSHRGHRGNSSSDKTKDETKDETDAAKMVIDVEPIDRQ